MKTKFLLFLKKSFQLWSVGLFLVLVCMNLPVVAQTPSQEKLPIFTGDVDNSGTYWMYTDNVKLDDDVYVDNWISGTSDFLVAFNFQFSIPVGAKIKGIKVSVGRYGDLGSQIQDDFVKLRKNGAFAGDNRAATTELWPATETLIEYGGETDLWGTTWTATDINDVGFGVGLAAKQPTSIFAKAHVDYMKISVYYEPLDPSYCAGAAVEVIDGNGTTNPNNALNAPDGEVAKILDQSGGLFLDLTGEVTPRPSGGKVTVKWRDGDPADGGNPMAYYSYATTYSSIDGYNWSSPIYYNVTSPTLVDQVLTVGENTRYLMFRLSSVGNKALDIDAVTYSCSSCPDPLLTPSVTITSSDDDNKICLGTNVVFTATPANTGGGTVAYRWFLNDYTYDSWNQSTWSHSELDENGYDLVRCEITVTGGTCLASTTAVSDVIDNDVYNSYPELAVTITSSNNGNEICDGTNVIFTATPENTGGGLVSYQWTYNTTTFPAGNWNTWSNSELHNGDVVSCQIIVTDAACFDEATAISNKITTTVIPKVGVSIASDDDDNIVCTGTSVTFTATLLDYIDGTIAYTWYNSSTSVGSDQSTYTATSLEDMDEIICLITVTGGTCPFTNPVASNVITVTVINCCTPGEDDSFEPNNSLANAKLLTVDGPEIYANILNSNDVDWFYFVTGDAGFYQVNYVMGSTAETMVLYNSSAKKLKPTEKNVTTYSLLANTTYYINVSAKLKSPAPCYSLGVKMIGATLFASEQYDELKSAEIETIPEGIFKIWPNPTNSEFKIYNGDEYPIQLKIMDVTGRQIETIENVGIAETVVFGSKYKPGIYFVNTSENGVQKVLKLIKQ